MSANRREISRPGSRASQRSRDGSRTIPFDPLLHEAKNILEEPRRISRPSSSSPRAAYVDPSAPFGMTASGHPCPHPDWERLYPGGVPNQRGHVLLQQYSMKPTATGLGYGPTHRSYYRYLSHYKQTVDPEQMKKAEEGAYKPRACPKEYSSGLGYGPSHQTHHWYLAPKTIPDLDPRLN